MKPKDMDEGKIAQHSKYHYQDTSHKSALTGTCWYDEMGLCHSEPTHISPVILSLMSSAPSHSLFWFLFLVL